MKSLFNQQTWVDANTWRHTHVDKTPATQCHVLLVRQALTQFLEQQYGLALDVHVHEQIVDCAEAMEASLLKIDTHAPCLRRKVSLLSQKEVMFDAESVLPLDLLPLPLMQELEAGKRPLANVLSEQGLSLSRSDLSITQIIGDEYYAQHWARRSVLRAESGATALVTEVFHDAIWRKLEEIQQASSY